MSGTNQRKMRFDDAFPVKPAASDITLDVGTVGEQSLPQLPGGDISSMNTGFSCQPSTSGEQTVGSERDEQDPETGLDEIFALSAPTTPALTNDPSDYLDDNGHRYVGLTNQAMTCYLNSLLQTLYMTPEFRNAVYEWVYKGNEEAEERSMLCQLQNLFVLLQTCETQSLETKSLTASFGWGGSEVYEQHDVQELCRLMFDALKQKWNKSGNCFQDYYRGTMEDFVQCLFCQKENVKTVEYLDLPLAVKPFGSTEAFKSLEEALHAFVKPEILEGSNQYFCENCKKKQDALKGFRVIEFPYILLIQLKRFDFDCNTLHRIKLNDQVTFPAYMNLNGFVYKPTLAEPPKKISWAAAVASPQNRVKFEDLTNIRDFSEYVRNAENDSGERDEEKVKAMLKDGPFVYELFSVMVHQGSAAGGHYFAYIKNLDQDRWFNFNDNCVFPATYKELQETFGGSAGCWSSGNTNAYMLMYRQINAEKNSHFIKTVDLPEHIKNRLSRITQQHLDQEKQHEYEKSLVPVSMLFNGASYIMPVEHESHITFRIPYYATLMEVFERALEEYDLKAYDTTRLRLLKCCDYSYSIERSFSEQEMTEIKLNMLSSKPTQDSAVCKTINYFLLDARPAGVEDFYEVHSFGETYTPKIFLIDVESNRIINPLRMQCLMNDTVVEIKQKIGKLCGLSDVEATKIRIVAEMGVSPTVTPTVLLLNEDHRIVSSLFCSVNNLLLFADAGGFGSQTQLDRENNFQRSRMFALLERRRNSKILFIRLPVLEDFKHAGMIPPASATTSRSITPPDPVQINAGSNMSSSNMSDDMQESQSEEANSEDEAMEMCSLSRVCTPVVSPVVSDCDDAGDMSVTDKFERVGNLQHVMSFSEQRQLSVIPEIRPDGFGTAASSSGTLIGGSQTYSSVAASQTQLSTSTVLDVVIVNRSCTDDGDQIEVDVDGRGTVGQFREWLANFINVDPHMFVIMKHYKEEDRKGYESTQKDSELISEAFFPANKLSLKLRPALKDDEKVIKIYRFDSHVAEDKMPTLFSVPAAADTQVRTVLTRCQDLLKKLYFQAYRLDQLRLREIVPIGAPMLCLGDQLGRRGTEWNANLYVQILTDEEVERVKAVKSMSYPVMVSRWKPQLLEVSPAVELLVPYDRQDQVAALKEQIAAHFRVPFGEVQISDAFPTHSGMKWPYKKDKIDLMETVLYDINQTPPNGTFNGRMIYFKLKCEKTRTLTEEEKRKIRIKENMAKSETGFRRKERPLRFQLSTSISEDNVVSS